MASYHTENFGCRAARADGEAVSERLRAAGLTPEPPALADVVVVNTCSVTAEADRQARAFIRKSHRLNPAAKIVVTGCYAQRAPQELASMAGVAAVIGNSHKALAPEMILGLTSATSQSNLLPVASILNGPAPIWADDHFAHSFLEDAQLLPGAQTRPNLKIQEGCANRCSFCVIPTTRGPSRSLPADKILQRIRGFVAAGGNELVLSGINLGRWGRDLRPGNSLASLTRQIFAETALPRLRFSSIEPMDWTPQIISLMAEFGGSRLARHAHLPLQSGSDAVLRRMHRRYRPWHYVEKVEALLHAVGPELTFGADVMVGFPGETDDEFEETRALIAALSFGYLHLFPFSPRPGTHGWAMHAANPVPPRVVKERMAALQALAAEKSHRHRQSMIGKTLDAVTLHTPEETQARNSTAALTENFLPVEAQGVLPANQLVRLKITACSVDGVLTAASQ